MTVKVYTEHLVETREEVCPEGWVEIDIYHPSSTITPWDYYGMKHQRELGRVLDSDGIGYQKLITHKKHLAPVGTGPGGAVRFGDNMMPGVYRIAVKEEDVGRAHQAINEHKKRVDDWINNGAPMPDACR